MFGLCRFSVCGDFFFFFSERSCVLCRKCGFCCHPDLFFVLLFGIVSIVFLLIVFNALMFNKNAFWFPCIPFRVWIVLPFDRYIRFFLGLDHLVVIYNFLDLVGLGFIKTVKHKLELGWDVMPTKQFTSTIS